MPLFARSLKPRITGSRFKGIYFFPFFHLAFLGSFQAGTDIVIGRDPSLTPRRLCCANKILGG
jgi:hypothetical protein